MEPPKHKDVTICGRTFRIRKLPAKTGSFVITKLSLFLGPIIASSFDVAKLQKVKSPTDVDLGNINFNMLFEKIGAFSEEDFNYLQDKALSVCSVLLEGNPNPVPVVQDNGFFSLPELEENIATVMALTVHALWFNLQSFLDGSPLAGLVQGVSVTTP